MKPTEQELKELGFFHTSNMITDVWLWRQETEHEIIKNVLIKYYPKSNIWKLGDLPINIQSLSDLKTLIKILSDDNT